MNQAVLPRFHPLIAQWFTEEIGQPTDVQVQAWPKIADGEHVLITAPTGSGKTLTAFLWAINQLVTGELPTGHTSVLYVSPLKALNNDIHRNLLRPLRELKEVFEKVGQSFPDIRVLTRSGDTPQSDRRRMQRHPPEILITTPESLNLLLSSVGGRSILTNISTVILDEIHAVVGTKRGTHLITAVDRLVRLCGEFQRIALSATIRPLETIAEFVAGYAMEGEVHAPRYTPRSVSVVRSKATKRYNVQVRFPQAAVADPTRESFWDPLIGDFKEVIAKNQSTLLFANSRRLCERLTLKINTDEEQPIAYAHHGSLSREIRETVEAKLKAGELKAIVATSSLEMGIDIGALDEVIFIQSPFSISSAIQRVGRAGHNVGEVSRGTLSPTHSRDFLDAAVLAEAILDGDIEAIKPVECPFDVLAQVIISMVAMEMWDLDELYVQMKTSYPYRHLRRQEFDQVLNMLAGRYADSRIRELKPRVSIDRLDNTVVARKGAIQAVYMSGGTIPNRGYFQMRHLETKARIGDLDEEFVWENQEGSVFTLGTQTWRVERVTHNEVLVLPSRSIPDGPPFWRAEDPERDFHFSQRIRRFLEEANGRLDDPDFADDLKQRHCMDETAATQLISYLENQKASTECDLPHRHHLLIEFVKTGPDGVPDNQVVIHTFWGGCVNRPFGLALASAWEERFGYQLEVHCTNESLVLMLADDVEPDELLSLVTSATLQSLLRKQLEGSGFFGARFRECAGRALLLTQGKINQRMPLWLSRLRSQKLLDAVMKFEDFPILLETWRTCLQDEFDLEGLHQVLTELESGSITWTAVHINYASPFAKNVSWRQIDHYMYMYMDDRPMGGKTSMLRDELLRDVVFNPGLRPTITRELVHEFELKRQRLSPGYSPQTSRDLVDWVKERLIIPGAEWESLLQAMRRDDDVEPEELVHPVADKIVLVTPPNTADPLIVAVELLPRIVQAFYALGNTRCKSSEAKIARSEDARCKVEIDPLNPETRIPDTFHVPSKTQDDDEMLTSLLGEWLQFYGTTTIDFIRKTLGIDNQRLQMALEDLIDSQKIITGQLVANCNDEAICDSENFEILLRMTRRDAIPIFEPLEIESLPLFLAQFQGLTEPGDDVDRLFRCIEQLICYSTQAELWETEIFPARTRAYATSWLDTIMLEGNLWWVGGEKHRITFCFEPDFDLMLAEEEKRENGSSHAERGDKEEIRGNEGGKDLFPEEAGRYDFSTLMQTSTLSATSLASRLWEGVWNGDVTNDTFMALRRGIESKFKLPEGIGVASTESSVGRGRRRRFSNRTDYMRWKNSNSFVGNWHRLSIPEITDDLLETEERKKERVRLLLERYGILFRELLQKELLPFRWSSVFRSLRIMELSGEVLAGCFFHGIPGPQFISHQAFRMLSRQLPEDAIYWINATDPVSLCGMQLDAIKGALPKRIASTHLVYRGSKVTMVSERNGKALRFNVPPDDAHLPEYLGVLRHLLTREFQPIRRIPIETINGDDAARSPYVDALRTAFDVTVDYKEVTLYRRLV